MKPNYRLLSVSEYIEAYRKELQDCHHLASVEAYLKPQPRGVEVYMLEFPPHAWVPGGAFPGNFAKLHIWDFRHYKVRVPHKNKKKGWKYVGILTTQELLDEERERVKYSLYSLPKRLFEKYAPLLIVTMPDGQRAQGSQLSDELLEQALAEMDAGEKSAWEQKQYKLDIELTPSAELPVQLRLDGRDDGAEERLFPDVESAHKMVAELRVFQTNDDRRYRHGLRATD